MQFMKGQTIKKIVFSYGRCIGFAYVNGRLIMYCSKLGIDANQEHKQLMYPLLIVWYVIDGMFDLPLVEKR